MTRSLPWIPVQYRGVIDPQPRDPGTHKAPGRPRPPKPIQPRDDGMNRTVHLDTFGGGGGKPSKPQPRDPGNGKGRVCSRGPQPRDDGSSCFAMPPKVQPRDPGGKKGGKRMIAPRDPGF